MKGIFRKISILMLIACCWTACKDDVTSAGSAVLDEDDAVIVRVDTFPVVSMIDSCDAIISRADSFLLGELETDFGSVRGSILTQLACPEGFSYPADVTVDSIDSICLFMYYSSWVGDSEAPLAINAYMMDKGTFSYSKSYKTDLNIADYCSKEFPILANERIVVASEKMDSVMDDSGNYIPVLRMKVNDDFKQHFGSILSFDTQEKFNQLFNGLLIESSFGSSTMLNISDVALGVYYHFGYKKGDRDTIVSDMKAFYANSEVRTVNHLEYLDKKELVENLQKDSDTYNYIIAPAGIYTRIVFPMKRISDSIMEHMVEIIDGDTILFKRPYVNKAAVRVNVTNVYGGTDADKTRNDWLQPASYMLLIKEESMERFFSNRELPSDTCALVSPLTQGTDADGETIYYYNYDMSDFLTNQLRMETGDTELHMMLVPVSISVGTDSNGSTVYSAVEQQQTLSATKIRSAKNDLKFEIVYSGFGY